MTRFNFAHLVGGRRGARAEEDEPEDKDQDAEEDEPEDKDKDETAEDSPKDDDDTEDDGGAEEDEPEEGARARAPTSAYARGRAAERARCAAILGSTAAAGNVAAACELAFNTDLPAKRAVVVLGALGPATKTGGGLAQAMAALGGPQVGSDGPAAGQTQGRPANPLVAAHAKATGRRPCGIR